jgi:CheY-like chemotaxis protein
MEKIFQDHKQYRVTLAEGGRQGWDLITSHAPQALILDLFMPEMDGFTILEKMRENAKLRDVPVVVVSGGDLTPQQQVQLNEFGKRMISKSSLNEKDLLSTIDHALKRIKTRN